MLGRYVDAGCSIVIVHAEASRHLHRTLARIRELGAAPGVALNPATPAAAVAHVLDLVDLVLVMTVNPGFGGQRYLATMEAKVAEVRAMVDRSGRRTEVEVDGGIAPAATVAGSPPGPTCWWPAARCSPTRGGWPMRWPSSAGRRSGGSQPRLMTTTTRAGARAEALVEAATRGRRRWVTLAGGLGVILLLFLVVRACRQPDASAAAFCPRCNVGGCPSGPPSSCRVRADRPRSPTCARR